MKVYFCPSSVEKSLVGLNETFLSLAVREMKEGHYINIDGIAAFYPLNMLKETPVHPLKAIVESRVIQGGAKS